MALSTKISCKKWAVFSTLNSYTLSSPQNSPQNPRGSSVYLTKLPGATAAGIHTAHPAISFFFSSKKKPKPSEHCPKQCLSPPDGISQPSQRLSLCLHILAGGASYRVDGQKCQLVVRAAVFGSNLLSLQVPAGEGKKHRERVTERTSGCPPCPQGCRTPLGTGISAGNGPFPQVPSACRSEHRELCPSWGGMGHWTREGKSSCRRKYPWLTPQMSRKQAISAGKF